MKKVALLLTRPMAESIFTREDLAFLQSFAQVNNPDFLPDVLTENDMLELIQAADACITCWGTPPLTAAMLTRAPDLRLVMHAAGSVKNLIPGQLWQTGCRVSSNAPVIAGDVAQTVLAFALTSLAGLWQNAAATRQGHWQGGESGMLASKKINGLKIGLIGFSWAGRETAKLFSLFDCQIMVYDPYTSPLELRQYGVAKVELDQLLRESDVVSLHAPANPDCHQMLNEDMLPLLKDGSILINTARGSLIEEKALVRELATGRIFACLDVTDPEPPAGDHPFRTLPNVVLTSHVAGGHAANGRKRLGANAIVQVYNCLVKGLLQYEIRPEMLEHMA